MSSDDELLALLARWTRNLDPARPLDLRKDGKDAKWYVNLDAWEHGGVVHDLRGTPAVAEIVDGIRVESRGFGLPASTHLFSGFRGTGKTTELSRLARDLEGLGFTVLRMSASNYHPLTRAISGEEMAVMLAAGIGEAALEQIGDKQVDDAAKIGVWERVKQGIERVYASTNLSLKLGPVELRAALNQGDSATANLAKLLGGRKDLLTEFLHGFVREIALALNPRQIVVIVDELEKFDVPVHLVGQVYREMADLFLNSSGLLKLPNCHTIYTVPPYVTFIHAGIGAKYDRRLHVLPSIKLRSRRPEHTPFEPGIAALRALLGERVDLQMLFGAECEGCIDRLIAMSGGNLKDLFTLTRDTIRAAVRRGLPVGMPEVERAIARHAAYLPLLKEPFELLRDVERGGDLTMVDATRQDGLAMAMDQHLLLSYWNGEFWYDTHPLIEPQLARHAADPEDR